MKEVQSAPNASALMESTRSVGYSFESAIADIIDNSISARAKNIWIESLPSSNPYIAILDDGDGMSSSDLEEAMRYGSDPTQERSNDDLGRFGLGLKMASLSQCRKLTVVSYDNGNISGCRWDLDRVIKSNQWILQILDKSELQNTPLIQSMIYNKKGTIVLWESLDRVTNKTNNVEECMADYIDSTRKHIALTFHRFMDNEAGLKKISVYLNNKIITPLNPFLSDHPTTEKFPEQSISIDGEQILIKPFILPPLQKMTAKDKLLLGDVKNLRRLQGFYVYRNKRLIIPGTWFKLTEAKELRNLARVRVDIPNTLDFLWDIDIKKSTATLPAQLRGSFVQFLNNVTSRSEQIHHFRGWKTSDKTKTYVWDRMDCRDEYRYLINKDHPMISGFKSKLSDDFKKEFDDIVKLIESTIPFSAIYNDIGGGNNITPKDDENSLDQMYIAGLEIIQIYNIAIDNLAKIEPFCYHLDVIEKLRGRKSE